MKLGLAHTQNQTHNNQTTHTNNCSPLGQCSTMSTGGHADNSREPESLVINLSVDHQYDDMEGEIFVLARNKRVEPDSSPGAAGSPSKLKKSKTDQVQEQNLFIFIKGKSDNIALFAKNKPLLFKRELIHCLGDVCSVEIVGQALRVKCHSVKQKDHALKLTEIAKLLVEISEPYSNKNREGAATQVKTPETTRGIIFGVGLDESDDSLAEALDAVWAKRQKKRGTNGTLENTKTVVFAVKGKTLPEYVSIGFFQKRVKKYVPNPYRCHACQLFGHKEGHCSTKPKCAQCSDENHTYDNCPNKNAPKCVNCKGPHNAGYKGCPKYQEIQNILIIGANENIPFAEAAKKSKEVSQQLNHEMQFIADISENSNNMYPTYTTEYPALSSSHIQTQSREIHTQPRIGVARYIQHSGTVVGHNSYAQRCENSINRPVGISTQQIQNRSNQTQSHVNDNNAQPLPGTSNNATTCNIAQSTFIDIEAVIERVAHKIESNFMARLEKFIQQIIMLLETANINKESLDKIKETVQDFFPPSDHINKTTQE